MKTIGLKSSKGVQNSESRGNLKSKGPCKDVWSFQERKGRLALFPFRRWDLSQGVGILRLLFDYLNVRETFVDGGILGFSKTIVHRKCCEFDLMVIIGGDYLGTAFGDGIRVQYLQFAAAHSSSHITQRSKLRKAAHWRVGLACSVRQVHAAWLWPESHSPAR